MDNSTPLTYHFVVDGNDFSSAGEASVKVKKILREIGFDAELIRAVSIAMYEAEINMVIHAGGGENTPRRMNRPSRVSAAGVSMVFSADTGVVFSTAIYSVHGTLTVWRLPSPPRLTT